MKSVTCNTLVWLREQPHEAGTKFSVVEKPAKPNEVDPHTADRWRMNGWLVEGASNAAAAGEGG